MKLSKIFDKANDKMWTDIRKVYDDVSVKSRSELEAVLGGIAVALVAIKGEDWLEIS